MSDSCSICGNPIKGITCKHPWNLPFASWPDWAMADLKRLLSATG